MTIVFENQLVEIIFFEDKKVLLWHWKATKEQLSDELFFQICSLFLKFTLLHKPEAIIDHALNLNFAITAQTQQRLVEELISQGAGLVKRVAHVMPSNFVAKLTADQLWESISDTPYEEKFFENEQEAWEWISGQ